MYLLKENTQNSKKMLAKDTKIGDLMRIIDLEHNCLGHILLRSWQGLVSLNDPHKTWNREITIEVQLLSRGESVTLIAE